MAMTLRTETGSPFSECVNTLITHSSRRQPPDKPGNWPAGKCHELGEAASPGLMGRSRSRWEESYWKILSHWGESRPGTSPPLTDSGSGQGGQATPGAKPEGWLLSEL